MFMSILPALSTPYACNAHGGQKKASVLNLGSLQELNHLFSPRLAFDVSFSSMKTQLYVCKQLNKESLPKR